MIIELELDTKTVEAIIQLKLNGCELLKTQLSAYKKAKHRLLSNIDVMLSISRYFHENDDDIFEDNINGKLRMLISGCQEIQTLETKKYFFNQEDVGTLTALSSVMHCAEFIIEHREFKRESMLKQIYENIEYVWERIMTRTTEEY